MQDSVLSAVTGASDLQRFTACMEYQPGPRPNHELGVWGQTRARWEAEAPDTVKGFTWDWFVDEPALGLDHREYININCDFIPAFPLVLGRNCSANGFYWRAREFMGTENLSYAW
jgi:hypothetical protein